MKRLGRRGRLLKRTGTVALLLLGLIWAGSLWWTVSYASHRGSWVDRRRGKSRVVNWGNQIWLSGGCAGYAGYRVLPAGDGWSVTRRRDWPRWAPHFFYKEEGIWWLGLPLWMPFVVLAMTVGYLWRVDRPLPAHCCDACGYNLTGNTSGVCPECGQQVRWTA